jgi:hypothetical protein
MPPWSIRALKEKVTGAAAPEEQDGAPGPETEAHRMARVAEQITVLRERERLRARTSIAPPAR